MATGLVIGVWASTFLLAALLMLAYCAINFTFDIYENAFNHHAERTNTLASGGSPPAPPLVAQPTDPHCPPHHHTLDPLLISRWSESFGEFTVNARWRWWCSLVPSEVTSMMVSMNLVNSTCRSTAVDTGRAMLSLIGFMA